MKKLVTIIVIVVLLGLVAVFGLHFMHMTPHGEERHGSHKGNKQVSNEISEHADHKEMIEPVHNEEGGIEYYTCAMHPDVRISVESYENGETNCPICSMPLLAVKKDQSVDEEFDEDIIAKVSIKARGLKLAGVKTEMVHKRHLFKEIRAVGKVAYDPDMAIAQDEYISAAVAYEKAKLGNISEIEKRSKSLVESSKRKLLLMGLGEDQIEELARLKEVQTSLVLPGKKMWIYGDVYEYELPWIKKGSDILAKPIGLVGEEFGGKIVSINPVIDPRSRSIRFRALVDNKGNMLKPEMYVDVQIMSQYESHMGHSNVVAIPKSALLDTGRRRIVWIDKGNGDFEGRAVVVGPESISRDEDERRFYPVLRGVVEGEQVVTKGNFLIDSQSQITGVISSSYGGALDAKSKQKNTNAGHQGH